MRLLLWLAVVAAAAETPLDASRRLADTLQLNISLHRPRAVRRGGLASVHLYTGAPRTEPPAVDRDGRPVSASVRISSRAARALLNALEATAFFGRAHRGYSERREDSYRSSDPPAEHGKRPPRPNADAWGSVRVIVNDADWFRYYERPSLDHARLERLFDAVLAAVDPEARPPLKRLRARLDAE